MLAVELQPVDVKLLRQTFGSRLRENVSLARYTSARLGGAADALLPVRSRTDMVEAVRFAWAHHIPYLILGSGSNVLVSDRGVRGLVLLNQARRIRFDEQAEIPSVWVESGANFGAVARQAAARGLAGLEWAVSIPGTVGGAVVGNAGAHGSDMAGSLLWAEILHRRELTAGSKNHGTGNRQSVIGRWPPQKMGYAYRSSRLKPPSLPVGSENYLPDITGYQQFLVLSAMLRLERGDADEIQRKMAEFVEHRRRTQPPGASMGSMFKNPPGDYAGRLIEAAGLKGAVLGGAQISPVHGNFFINLGHASASDFAALIDLARQTVADKFAVNMELEIQLVGEW